MNNNQLTVRVVDRNMVHRLLSAVTNMAMMRTIVFTYEQSNV